MRGSDLDGNYLAGRVTSTRKSTGTPSRYTMAISAPRLAGKSDRRRAFMADPFKHPKSGIYYLRRKVPVELKEILGQSSSGR